MEPWELMARERIRDAVARYAHLADTGRFEELAELFTTDGVLEIADGETCRGRERIRDFLVGAGARLRAASSRPLVRHHVSNLLIDVTSSSEATGRCYFLVLGERGKNFESFSSKTGSAPSGSSRFPRPPRR